MKNKNENLDDVVFEKRNKNYGAYFLRKSYNKNVTRALFLSTLFFLGVVSIPLIAGLMNKGGKITLDGDTIAFEIIKPPVEEPIIEKPIEKPLIERIRTYQIIVVDSSEVIDDSALLGLMDSIGNDLPFDSTEVGPLVIKENKKPPIIDPHKEAPLVNVQEMPDFVGGLEKMYKYLSDNIDYPAQARDNGIKGTVCVTFVVEKDGSITNASLLNDIGAGCGAEALRVVKSMPKWKPGKQNGTLVRVQFNLPVRFILE